MALSSEHTPAPSIGGASTGQAGDHSLSDGNPWGNPTGNPTGNPAGTAGSAPPTTTPLSSQADSQATVPAETQRPQGRPEGDPDPAAWKADVHGGVWGGKPATGAEQERPAAAQATVAGEGAVQGQPYAAPQDAAPPSGQPNGTTEGEPNGTREGEPEGNPDGNPNGTGSAPDGQGEPSMQYWMSQAHSAQAKLKKLEQLEPLARHIDNPHVLAALEAAVQGQPYAAPNGQPYAPNGVPNRIPNGNATPGDPAQQQSGQYGQAPGYDMETLRAEFGEKGASVVAAILQQNQALEAQVRQFGAFAQEQRQQAERQQQAARARMELAAELKEAGGSEAMVEAALRDLRDPQMSRVIRRYGWGGWVHARKQAHTPPNGIPNGNPSGIPNGNPNGTPSGNPNPARQAPAASTQHRLNEPPPGSAHYVPPVAAQSARQTSRADTDEMGIFSMPTRPNGLQAR